MNFSPKNYLRFPSRAGTHGEETVYNKEKGKQDHNGRNACESPSQLLRHRVSHHDEHGSKTERGNDEDKSAVVFHVKD